MARARGVMVFVLDWTEDGAARASTRTAAMDVVRAIARARAPAACGLVLFTSHALSRRRCGRKMVMPLTRDYDFATALTSASDAEFTMDVIAALKLATLNLKAFRDGGCGDDVFREIVLITRDSLDMSSEDAAAILRLTLRARAKCHVLRAASTNATAAEVNAIRTLCRCCAMDSGACLGASLGACTECGVSVGLNAQCELKRAIVKSGFIREDDAVGGDDDVAPQRQSPAVSVPFAAGCRDTHAEFANYADDALVDALESSSMQIGVDVKLKHLERVTDDDDDDDPVASTSQGQKKPSSKHMYRSVVKNARIFLNIEDVALVSRALDEPIARVRCGALLPCYGANAGKLRGAMTLKVDAAHRHTGAAIEVWLNMDDSLVCLATRSAPRRETVLQRVSFNRAEAFRRAAMSGDENDIECARALGVPVIRHPLANDSSARAFSLRLGVGRGAQTTYHWLTDVNLERAIESLERLRETLRTPPTLETHTGLSKATLREMYVAYSACSARPGDDAIEAPPPAVSRPRSTPNPPPPTPTRRVKKQRDIEWLESMKSKHFATTSTPVVTSSAPIEKKTLDADVNASAATSAAIDPDPDPDLAPPNASPDDARMTTHEVDIPPHTKITAANLARLFQ